MKSLVIAVVVLVVVCLATVAGYVVWQNQGLSNTVSELELQVDAFAQDPAALAVLQTRQKLQANNRQLEAVMVQSEVTTVSLAAREKFYRTDGYLTYCVPNSTIAVLPDTTKAYKDLEVKEFPTGTMIRLYTEKGDLYPGKSLERHLLGAVSPFTKDDLYWFRESDLPDPDESRPPAMWRAVRPTSHESIVQEWEIELMPGETSPRLPIKTNKGVDNYAFLYGKGEESTIAVSIDQGNWVNVDSSELPRVSACFEVRARLSTRVGKVMGLRCITYCGSLSKIAGHVIKNNT